MTPLFRRILLNPLANEGGDGEPEPEKTETPEPEQKPAKKAAKAKAQKPEPEAEPSKPTPVQVDPTELAGLWKRLHDAEEKLKAQQAATEATLEAERQKALAKIAEKDGIEAALKQQKQDLEEKFNRAQSELSGVLGQLQEGAKQSVIDQALAGVAFIDPNAAEYVRSKLSARFVTEASEENPYQFRVRDSQTGQYVEPETVREQILPTQDFSWLIKSDATPEKPKGDPSQRPSSDNGDTDDLPAGLAALNRLAQRQNSVDQSFGLRPIRS